MKLVAFIWLALVGLAFLVFNVLLAIKNPEVLLDCFGCLLLMAAVVATFLAIAKVCEK